MVFFFLKKKKELSRPSLGRILIVVFVSMLLCTSLYFLIGILGYLRFGSSVVQFTNILAAYPVHDPVAVAARSASLVQMLLGYPIALQVGRITVSSFFSRPWVWWQNLIFTLVWMSSNLLIACLVENIGSVLVFVGATTPNAFIFIWPSIMLAKSFRKPEFSYWATRILCILCCVAGVAFGVVAIVSNFL